MCKCYLYGSDDWCNYQLSMKTCFCSCKFPLGILDMCCPYDNDNPYCLCCFDTHKDITYIEGDTEDAVLNYRIKRHGLREQHTISEVYCCCFQDKVISTKYKKYYKTEQDAINIINMLDPPQVQSMPEEGEVRYVPTAEGMYIP